MLKAFYNHFHVFSHDNSNIATVGPIVEQEGEVERQSPCLGTSR